MNLAPRPVSQPAGKARLTASAPPSRFSLRRGTPKAASDVSSAAEGGEATATLAEARFARRRKPSTTSDFAIRRARPGDAAAIHALILANLETGHLLPRTLDDVTGHVGRFAVAERHGQVVACGELAPLSRAVAEIRSLVVSARDRGHGIGRTIVRALRDGATRDGFRTLCVFAHEPAYFARMGFSIVPHAWLPEKIAVDCRTCSLFRTCGQIGLIIELQPGT